MVCKLLKSENYKKCEVNEDSLSINQINPFTSSTLGKYLEYVIPRQYKNPSQYLQAAISWY